MKFNVVKFCTNLTKFFYKLRTSAKGEGYVKCGQMRTGGSKKWSFCADVLYGRPLNKKDGDESVAHPGERLSDPRTKTMK